MAAVKILIGDDAPQSGLALAQYLKSRDMFAVTRPRNGKTVLEAIKTDSPDLVIVEATMAEFDGPSLCQRLRALFADPPPVIILSNAYSPELEKDAIESGARRFMVKPVDNEALFDAIRKIIGSKYAKFTGFSISTTSSELEYAVTDILHQVGIPAHIKGYHYLRSAIVAATRNMDALSQVTKVLYPAIAVQFDTSPSRVERAIRHAIEISWERGDVDVINEIFGFTVRNNRGKPTNSEFIAMISDKLILHYKAAKTA